jgi:putative holliday junction resolvase
MPSGRYETEPAENTYDARPSPQSSPASGRGSERERQFMNPGVPIDPLSGTLLAFDFGTKRIGIAVGNTVSATARPLTTINDEKNDARFTAIAALLAEWQPAALIVGLPCNDDGTPHEMTALCRRFANRLKGRFNLPTLLVDERYTSAAASSVLDEEGIHGRKQKSLIDQYAAQQILQAYFDEPSAGIQA